MRCRERPACRSLLKLLRCCYALRGVTFLSLNKKVTKEISLGESAQAFSQEQAFITKIHGANLNGVARSVFLYIVFKTF